jgi:hypothetical protein
MRLPEDVEDLRVIAEYHTARRSLRRMGWGGIVFGIINLGLGIAFTVNLGPINLVLALIGLFLVASGVWCLVLPGAEGVISNGIALILVGLWNIAVTLLNLAAGAAPQIWWAIFGGVLIAGGIQCFQKYARFSKALRYRVSEDEMAMMDRLVQTILKGDVKVEQDMVAFQARGFAQQKQWLGRLGDEAAVFVEKMSKEILVARKKKVRIKPHGKVLLGKSLKASVTIGKQHWEAVISSTSFDRFRDWKLAEDEDADEDYRGNEPEAAEHEPETGIRKNDRRDEEPPTGIKRRRSGAEDDE